MSDLEPAPQPESKPVIEMRVLRGEERDRVIANTIRETAFQKVQAAYNYSELVQSGEAPDPQKALGTIHTKTGQTYKELLAIMDVLRLPQDIPLPLNLKRNEGLTLIELSSIPDIVKKTKEKG